jgi:DNA-binding transcriptional LysR family regulator
MELRHLRYFVAVAEELHFGKAAERVGIAQPPLSNQIKALEREVGAELLARTKRSVALTAAGTAFLAEARRALAHAAQAARVAQRAARGEIGRLAVGFVDSAVYGVFPRVLRHMRAKYPELNLVLLDMNSDEQLQALRANQLDVGLIRPPCANTAGLRLETIATEPLMVALPQDHRLAKQGQVALGELANEPFIFVPRRFGSGYYDHLMAVCARGGFSPHVVQEAKAAQTMVSLVAGGLGVTLVPTSLINLQRRGVAYRPLEPPAPTTDLAVIWRQGDESAALEVFLTAVRQMAAPRAGERPVEKRPESAEKAGKGLPNPG